MFLCAGSEGSRCPGIRGHPGLAVFFYNRLESRHCVVLWPRRVAPVFFDHFCFCFFFLLPKKDYRPCSAGILPAGLKAENTRR
jgi:hypothetical protein